MISYLIVQQRAKSHQKVKKSLQANEEASELGDTGFSKAAASAAKRQGGWCFYFIKRKGIYTRILACIVLFI